MTLDRIATDAISIHALREEGDLRPGHHRHGAGRISIHALREEGDPLFCLSVGQYSHFYPRPPRGGRQAHSVGLSARMKFLSTPSARRAT